jgi:hypothetical protein
MSGEKLVAAFAKGTETVIALQAIQLTDPATPVDEVEVGLNPTRSHEIHCARAA